MLIFLLKLLLVALIIFTGTTVLAQSDDKKIIPPATIKLFAPEDVEELLIQHFKLPATILDNKTKRSIFMRRAKQEISELLATEGYFAPTIKLQQHPQQDLPTLEIEPGTQTLVGKVTIEFQGELAIDAPQQRERVAQLRRAWSLKTGEPFRSSAWESAKANLLADITREEYAAAYLVTSQATIDPNNSYADLMLIIDSGPAFYFGELTILGLDRYQEETLNIHSFRTFNPGDPYRRDLLFAFQTSLQNLPHFSSVIVSTDADINMHKAIPVNVTITEKKAKHIALGAGFSSNNGARGEINFRNHNFLTRAWDMHTLLRIEQKRQTFSSGVSTLPNQDNYQFSLGARLQRTDIENLETINQRISLSRSHRTIKTLRQLGLIWQREEKNPSGGISQINEALALDWRWRYHTVDNPLHIRRGNVTEARIGGSQQLVSDQSFIRAYTRQQMWWPIGKRDVLYLRGEAGYTLAESRFGIPQEFLFRAGGIQSVRGLDFLNLGVREGNAVVGGRTLATGTLEYTHWLSHDWGAAFFTDIGDAADNWKNFNPEIGYGAGIRWRSPAGPLALDLARRNKTGTLRLHFSIIVAF